MSDFAQLVEAHKTQLFMQWFPLVFCYLILACSCTSFVFEYDFFQKTDVNQIIYVDFFTFFAIFVCAVTVLFCVRNFYAHFVAVTMGLIAAVLMQYTGSDLFTIKIFIFAVWIVSLLLNIPWGYNVFFAAGSCAVLLVVQFHPDVFGAVDTGVRILEPDSVHTATAAVYMLIAFFCAAAYRFILEKWAEQVECASHLNVVMSQLSTFNQELQDAVKMSGKEAAQQERMRITRDMHDSCGYVFVNIIALMEAAESNRSMTQEQIDEAFLTVRNLAADGLKQTRKTLHAIRDIQNPVETSIAAIYEIKRIFEKVTGIHVTIQSGNIKNDYGHTINSIIIHTMQESLTNAIRHGRARNIFVAFWEENDELSMRVEDDGIGAKKIVKGIGLAGMEERLSRVGGVLELSSLERGGIKLIVRIPLLRQKLENENE